jgi:hypothetical protein
MLFQTIAAPILTSANPPASGNGAGISRARYIAVAAGTRIQAAAGEVAVDNLAAGDLVIGADGAETPVIELSHRTMLVGGAKYLVRIAAGAVAPGLPQRDLLVAQEQCLLLDGAPVPAGRLLNGGSITLDRTVMLYSCYHVMLGRGMVLQAEGLAMQAAPGDPPQALPQEADLHLLTDCGQVLRAVSAAAGRYVFILPETVKGLRLRSRVACRATRIILTRGRRSVALHPAGAAPGGWTQGEARLIVPDNNGLKLPGVLEVQLLTIWPHALEPASNLSA